MFTPLRSVLYMPSSNERALEKAKTIPADGIIFDLEDAVAPDAKVEARGKAAAMGPAGDGASSRVVVMGPGGEVRARGQWVGSSA